MSSFTYGLIHIDASKSGELSGELLRSVLISYCEMQGCERIHHPLTPTSPAKTRSRSGGLRTGHSYGGPGYELEVHENPFLFKLGSEYSFEVTENFEIALNMIYENRQDIYDGITFGVAFNKKLWERK